MMAGALAARATARASLRRPRRRPPASRVGPWSCSRWPRSDYTANWSIRSSARRWSGCDRVVTVKVGASASAEVQHVLRTMVASSVRSVWKLWMGVPSAWCRRATFAFAAAERAAGATGSRVAPAAWSSSVKSSSRQASFRCHSTVWASM